MKSSLAHPPCSVDVLARPRMRSEHPDRALRAALKLSKEVV